MEVDIKSELSRSRGWPAPIKGWRVEKGYDSTGQDAIWVWVTLANPLQSRDIRSAMRRMIRDKVASYVEPDPTWVYVRFRGESEVEAE